MSHAEKYAKLKSVRAVDEPKARVNARAYLARTRIEPLLEGFAARPNQECEERLECALALYERLANAGDEEVEQIMKEAARIHLRAKIDGKETLLGAVVVDTSKCASDLAKFEGKKIERAERRLKKLIECIRAHNATTDPLADSVSMPMLRVDDVQYDLLNKFTIIGEELTQGKFPKELMNEVLLTSRVYVECARGQMHKLDAARDALTRLVKPMIVALCVIVALLIIFMLSETKISWNKGSQVSVGARRQIFNPDMYPGM